MKNKASKESNLVVKGILGYLSDTGKDNLLASVSQVLDEAVDKTKHADEIIITSAVPLSKTQLKKLGSIVTKFLGRDLPATNKIDKSLLAGFAIKVGDFYLDASLATELASVKRMILS